MTRCRTGLALLLALGLVSATGASAQPQEGFAGAYLAARSAATASDYREAADYFRQALARDPDGPQLADFSLISELSLGDFADALPLAKRLAAGSEREELANIVLLVDGFDRKAWDEVIATLAKPQVSPLIDGLAKAWAEVGAGRMSEAIAAFDALAAQEALRPLAQVNKALALGSVGDFEGAEAILSDPALPPTRRGTVARAQVLSQLDRATEAVALIDEVFGPETDSVLQALRGRLAAGEAVPFDVIRSPSDGLAEVFLGVAGALSDETDRGYTLIYARAAEHLKPDFDEAVLMVAQLLEAQGQYDLATESYKRIPRESPAFPAAEMGRASALYDAGREDAATEVLEQLSRSFPDLAGVHVAYGDMLRRQEKFTEAVGAYDKALALIGTPAPQQWPLLFARGIAEERSGQWDKAEADFKKALELSPDQPAVLNYLGYSYLEKKENLDLALDMISRAVAARPDDGAITDSLGWGMYRLGRYDDAVDVMERAVELMPVDAVVNDHLGDVFWAVGRKLEAEFQWRRALSFEPAEVDAKRIRRKLEVGLDAVLKEEGAPPIVRTGSDK